MGRRFRTEAPQLPKQFIPNWSHLGSLKAQYESYKNKQEYNYDVRHRSHEGADLSDGSEMSVTGGSVCDPVPGQVMRPADTPRSYIVSTPSGQVRGISRHLVPIPERVEREDAKHQPSQATEQNVVPDLSAPTLVWDPIMTRSKTGTKTISLHSIIGQLS